MEYRAELQSKTKEAMKAGDKERVAALRLIGAELLKKEKEKGVPVTEEAEFFAVLKTMAKQRAEAIESFEAAGNAEGAAAEKAELEIIEDFLPRQMSAEELAAEVDKAIAELGVEDMKGMGKVMGMLSQKLAGRVDNKLLSGIVREKLGA